MTTGALTNRFPARRLTGARRGQSSEPRTADAAGEPRSRAVRPSRKVKSVRAERTDVQLEEYWGVGPATAATLREALGEEAAIAAIDAADTGRLVDAGLGEGRVLRILRRADDDAAMDLLATSDARSVYRSIVDRIASFAVSRRAADRVRVLAPLSEPGAMIDRIERVIAAREGWEELDEGTREAVLEAYAGGEDDEDRRGNGDGDLVAVGTAIRLREALKDGDLEEGEVFTPLAALDAGALADAAAALGALGEDGSIAEGADEELDRLRDDLAAVEDLTAEAAGVAETVRSAARDASEFPAAVRRHVTRETGIDAAAVEAAMPDGAADASAFVTETLRGLADDLRDRVDERERTVRERLKADLEAARDDVDAAVEAVDRVAVSLTLARFAAAFDLRAPTLSTGGEGVLAVRGARNLDLAAGGGPVQPITYALGDHSLSVDGGAPAPPGGDRVTVLTGANSGGKTTLLETLCATAVLAHMGLPVPAEEAEIRTVDRVVFHRRHASFNAGVLESTLKSVVPPVTREGRTLLLVDEFEAITEPGSAADLLAGLVRLAVDRGALGAFVTHLADDLDPLPEPARIDGIFAKGLTGEYELDVDYQPRFGTVGRSTPEFIVSRLVATADDPVARQGFEALAEALGQERVQRTLADAAFTAGSDQS